MIGRHGNHSCGSYGLRSHCPRSSAELLGQALQRLQALDYSNVSVRVLVENSRAIRFYECLELEADADSLKEVEIGGRAVKEIRYVKKLVPT